MSHISVELIETARNNIWKGDIAMTTLPVRPRPHAFVLAALGALTAAASLASPAVAWAAEPSAGGLQTNVYYDLQQLSTERGTREVYRRIASAARDVCPGYDSNDEDAVAASKVCQRQAIARAIAQIGNARLAAIDARLHAWQG
jgi:UrcA family protein